MVPLPLEDKVYKYKHEMLYYKVMRQLKTYRLNTVFIVSLEFVEHGYVEIEGVRIPCIDINSIDASSYQILCLINNDFNSRWVRGFGRDF